MRADYVSLTVQNLDSEDSGNTPRRSLRRVNKIYSNVPSLLGWNQLSRFQRNIISLLVIIFLFYILYFWSMMDVPDVSNEIKLEPLEVKIVSDHLQLKLPMTESPQGNFVAEDAKVEEVVHNEEMRKEFDASVMRKDVLPMVDYGSNQSTITQLVSKSREPVVFPLDDTDRQKAVVIAFKHAWAGYKKYAWGHDYLKPISMGYHNWFGLGLTIVDSLDTLYIMRLKEEFAEARNWVTNQLNFNRFKDVNLFEVTIRVLGGLLSAFHFSADKAFLNKALELGERLLPPFLKSPSGIPFSDVNLAAHTAHSPRWSPDSSTSEVTTVQLEFRDLARQTHQPKFEEAVSHVSRLVHNLPKMDGLVPIFINPTTGQFHKYTDIKLGARGDSYYEYLLKQWIQTGKTIDYLRDDYIDAIEGIQKWLVRRTSKNNLLFIGELKGGSRDFVPKMDHLVCYLPGTLALGVHHGLSNDHMRLAEELLYTCYQTYVERPTCLAPEITFFNIQNHRQGTGVDFYVKTSDAHNLLRPEFIESLWYMYQITGNTTYQDWGWRVFQSFEKHTKVKNGYTSIGNVNNKLDTRPRDMMESFFLSETLKYFYLLFSNDRYLIDLNKYVFNTEAHPMPIYSS